MSAHLLVPAVYEVICNEGDCHRRFREAAFSVWDIRGQAEGVGWQVRPRDGKGSRTAPDHCPWHREFACPDCGSKPLEWMGDNWYCHGCGNEYGHCDETPEPGWVPDA